MLTMMALQFLYQSPKIRRYLMKPSLLWKILCAIALTISVLLALLIPRSIAFTSPQPASGIEALHHHPVSTRNAEAQLNFDRGLTLVYALNHQEAVRAFQRAAELDPQLAKECSMISGYLKTVELK
jgi:hypothetical protein